MDTAQHIYNSLFFDIPESKQYAAEPGIAFFLIVDGILKLAAGDMTLFT